MKRHPWLTRSLTLVALAITVGGAGALWPASRVTAIESGDLQPVEFGLLGLAAGNMGAPHRREPRAASAARSRQPRTIRAPNVRHLCDRRRRTPARSDHTRRQHSRPHHVARVARHSRVVSLRPGQAASLAFTATAADTYFSAVALGRTGHVPGHRQPGLSANARGDGGQPDRLHAPGVRQGLQPAARPARRTLARLGTERRAHHERTKQQDTTDCAHGDHLHSGLHGRGQGPAGPMPRAREKYRRRDENRQDT